MGTRGAFGFLVDGETKVMYNHWDSYPDGLGESVLSSLADVTDFEPVKEAVRAIRLVSEEDAPTADDIEKYADYSDLRVSGQTLDEWYVLLRNVQGSLDAYLSPEPLDVMIGAEEFLADSLFCEYAYIVNLDNYTLEFYRGFNKDGSARGRYAMFQSSNDGRSNEYYGVVLIGVFPLEGINPDTVEEHLKSMNHLIDSEDD